MRDSVRELPKGKGHERMPPQLQCCTAVLQQYIQSLPERDHMMSQTTIGKGLKESKGNDPRALGPPRKDVGRRLVTKDAKRASKARTKHSTYSGH